MCDNMTSQCCILNPTASMTLCTASGGKISTDPCNVLNPAANKSVCTAQIGGSAAKTAGGSTSGGFAVVGIIIGGIAGFILLVVGGVFLFAKLNSSKSTEVEAIQGGARKLIKRLFRKRI